MATQTRPHPYIAVRMTSSSEVLDLAQQTPFTISLALTLDHRYPITFDPRSTTLFNGNLLHDDGLTLTNTTTGERLPRNTRDRFYESASDDDAIPSEQSKNAFVTLYPGKEHVLRATLEPMLSNNMFSTQGLTAQEILAKQDKMPKTWKWPNVAGMQDRDVYKLGLREQAGVGLWMQGSIETLLEIRRAGMRPDVRRETVPFVVEESAQFEVRRPDTDGSLNWP